MGPVEDLSPGEIRLLCAPHSAETELIIRNHFFNYSGAATKIVKIIDEHGGRNQYVTSFNSSLRTIRNTRGLDLWLSFVVRIGCK